MDKKDLKPCGDSMFGECQICHKEKPLQRKYYYYPIKCECHSPWHFELVDHCADCIPTEPKSTKVTMKAMNTRPQISDEEIPDWLKELYQHDSELAAKAEYWINHTHAVQTPLWISVDDGLPEDTKDIIGYHIKSNSYYLCHRYFSDSPIAHKFCTWENDGDRSGDYEAGVTITHWLPIPVLNAVQTDTSLVEALEDLTERVKRCRNIIKSEGGSWNILDTTKADQALAHRKEEKSERFKMPTDKQLCDVMVLFNDGELDAQKLADMLAPCEFVVNRLYENGDVSVPSSIEDTTSDPQESEKGCDTCKFIDCDGKEPCNTCGDGDYMNYQPNN